MNKRAHIAEIVMGDKLNPNDLDWAESFNHRNIATEGVKNILYALHCMLSYHVRCFVACTVKLP